MIDEGQGESCGRSSNDNDNNNTTMKRAIATLASLAVIATAGPLSGVSASAVSQPSKFSDRFLTSLEEVDADAVAVVETNEEENMNALMDEGDDRRRRLSWWSFVLMLCKCLL